MDQSTLEYEHSLAFAEITLSQIKALRQPMTPRYYEIWYTYATGHFPFFNQAINEILARNGTLTVADLAQIYADHISPFRVCNKIGAVGASLVNEIDRILPAFIASDSSAWDHAERLHSVKNKLASASNREDLQGIAQQLIQAVTGMKENSQLLEKRLAEAVEQINELQQNLRTIREEGLSDTLTGIASRKGFDESLARSLTQSGECGEPLSIVMTDIDHFMSFNNTWGYLTGDHVLRLVADSIKANVKLQDIAARYGGDEFAVILPNTGLRMAHAVAERMRRSIMSRELIKRSTGQSLGRVSISIGIARARKRDTPASLIARAGASLDAAKRSGRNRIVCETDPEALGTERSVA